MIGILFKVMHWPGTAMLLYKLVQQICCRHFHSTSSLLNQNIPGNEKRIYTLGAVSLIIFELATLFKMMHYWPGAGPLLVVGSFRFDWRFHSALYKHED